MTEIQHYSPYRTSILSRHQLCELNRLDPRIVVRDTLIGWAIIVAAWTVVAIHPVWWVVVAAIVVVGVEYYGLAIIGHDGIHRRLFDSKQMNDLWNDLFIMAPICAITRLNRRNHIEHHLVTSLPTDPDRYKYLHEHKDTTFSYLYFLSGLQCLGRALTNIYVRGEKQPHAGGEQRAHYTARDFALILGWQAALIGGLTYAIGWWAYPVLWLAPVYIFAYRADLVRVFCEHSMQMPDSAADEHKRMITYTSNPVERWFFAPHNMNFHTAHHLWPSIPYHNLPAADRLVRAWAAEHGPTGSLIWRSSYLGYMISYWNWSRQQRGVEATATAPTR